MEPLIGDSIKYESLLELLHTKVRESDDDVVVNINDVRILFARAKAGKATGQDGISNKLLKACSQQLAEVFTAIFQTCLDTGDIPQLWKSSIITPVPKVTKPVELNHYRPVAITSNVMKCFENILAKSLRRQTGLFDPTQYAYQTNRSVEDAVLVFLHKIYQHLEIPKAFVMCFYWF